MILEETINKLLRDSCNLVLATPGFMIRAKQNSSRPNGSYGDVQFMGDQSVGWEQRTLVDNDGDLDLTETIKGMRSVRFSMQFYRDSAYDNARKIRTGLARQSIIELFRTAKVGLLGRTEILSIDEPLSEGWEQRSMFDISLSVVGVDQDIIKSIQSVDMAGAYEVNGLTYDFNLEIP